jgi:hypothetical protein
MQFPPSKEDAEMADFWKTVLISVVAGGLAGILGGTLVPAVLQHRRWRREREDEEAAKKAMIFENGFYWKKLPDGNREGPFCPRCLDADGKQIRLHERYGYSKWSCLTCNQGYDWIAQ